MSVCPSKAGFHPEIGYETLEILNVMQPQNFSPRQGKSWCSREAMRGGGRRGVEGESESKVLMFLMSGFC